MNLLPPDNRKDMQRQLKSLPTLKGQVGGFYHMEGKSSLALVDNITHGIAFMPLSFN